MVARCDGEGLREDGGVVDDEKGRQAGGVDGAEVVCAIGSVEEGRVIFGVDYSGRWVEDEGCREGVEMRRMVPLRGFRTLYLCHHAARWLSFIHSLTLLRLISSSFNCFSSTSFCHCAILISGVTPHASIILRFILSMAL